MKILLVSDEEDKYLWDFYKPGRLKGIDLILSAGDLKAEYLSFLVTMANRPRRHHPGKQVGGAARRAPECSPGVAGTLVKEGGLRILGLGGSALYNGGPHQYTETQMRRRIHRLRLKLALAGGVDIVLTHAPVRGFGDEDNVTHRGFEAFLPLLDQYQPQYLVHGHIHQRYGANRPRCYQYNETTIVNATGRYILEFPDKPGD